MFHLIGWDAYEGAEYHLSTDYKSWSDAKALCVSHQGDLATIPNYAVQKFIKTTFGTDKDLWIGATDSTTEGTFTWSKGDAYSYNNWEDCSFQPTGDGDDCARIESGKDVRWKDKNCADYNRYICQKGTTNTQLWNAIHGAEYAFLHSEKCIKSFTDAQNHCQNIGGELASIQSQVVMDELLSTFSGLVTGNVIIGATDDQTEGTFRWIKGENFVYTNWKSGEPQNANDKDCVYVEPSGVWKMFKCSHNDANSALCMKGTSTSFDEPAISTVTWTFTQRGSTGRRYWSNWKDSTIQDYTQGPSCCEQCGAESASTNWIAFDTASGPNTCYCYYEATDAEPPTTDDSGWKYGSCRNTASGRKKRHDLGWDELMDSSDSVSRLATVVKSKTEMTIHPNKSYVVKRNAQDILSKEREITCEAIWSDSANYWSYDYEVPNSCWSKWLQ